MVFGEPATMLKQLTTGSMSCRAVRVVSLMSVCLSVVCAYLKCLLLSDVAFEGLEVESLNNSIHEQKTPVVTLDRRKNQDEKR